MAMTQQTKISYYYGLPLDNARVSWVVFLIAALACLSCSNDRSSSKSGIKEKLTASVDTMVVIPPAWAFGVLYGGYTDQKGTIETINKIIQHDYPIDAYWIDSWFWSFNDQGRGPAKYIDFIADTTAFPDRTAMWDFMQQHQIKGGFWIWDCILKTGNEQAYAEFEEKGFFSSVYLNTNPWHNKGTSTAMFQSSSSQGTLCGNIDFANAAAASLFKHKIKHFFDEGADFIKLDRTTNIATCKTMFEATQEHGRETKGRGFMLSHSDGTDDPAYKRYPAKWTDDTRSDWTIDSPTKDFNTWVPKVAFKENIEMFTDPSRATSQIPFLTNDTGGFDMGKTDAVDEELYIRWVQFSMFNPITEVFSQPENRTGNLAFNYSQKADSIFRAFAHWRMTLFPYIYSYALKTRLTGSNMIRRVHNNFQFLFGDEMLIAPVYESGAKSRTVTLPEGEWLDYWTNMPHHGGDSVVVDAQLERIPVFIRSGAIIPQRLYSSSVEKGNNDLLEIHLYLTPDAPSSTFTVLEDDGVSNDYLKNIFAVTSLTLQKTASGFEFSIGAVEGDYVGMKAQRQWKIVVHTPAEACTFRLNDRVHQGKKEGGVFDMPEFESNINESISLTITLE
jgi:alpha-glucosidase (family GH31 glycosyl hydrolase)